MSFILGNHVILMFSLSLWGWSHLELPFHWQIMKPNLHPLFPGETPEPSHIQFHLATDDAFQVSPLTGVLAPCQEQEFLFTFCPQEVMLEEIDTTVRATYHTQMFIY